MYPSPGCAEISEEINHRVGEHRRVFPHPKQATQDYELFRVRENGMYPSPGCAEISEEKITGWGNTRRCSLTQRMLQKIYELFRVRENGMYPSPVHKEITQKNKNKIKIKCDHVFCWFQYIVLIHHYRYFCLILFNVTSNL